MSRFIQKNIIHLMVFLSIFNFIFRRNGTASSSDEKTKVIQSDEVKEPPQYSHYIIKFEGACKIKGMEELFDLYIPDNYEKRMSLK